MNVFYAIIIYFYLINIYAVYDKYLNAFFPYFRKLNDFYV